MRKPYIVLTILTLLISCGGGKDKPGQEKHCYTNHGTGEFLSTGREPIETVVRAWTNDDPAYTLESVYKKAPVF